jgi:glycosyltransferase involved in cell wall biosynthesis
MAKRKILFIAQHRLNRSPSQRFRFEQYLSLFEAHGYECELSFLIDQEDDKVFYSKGNIDKKARIVAKSFKRRQSDAARADSFDIIFVQREAFMTGTTIFERKFAKSKAKLVFDFDDSIWLSNVSEANKALNFLKNAGKTAKIISVSDHIIAGNDYLADYAKTYNQNVSIIPTTIDTESYKPISKKLNNNVVTIGWSGSITTIQHFNHAVPVLKRLKEKYADRIAISVVGDGNYEHEELGIKGKAWNASSEIEDLCAMDIGIMPLPDDEWAKGKCGLKGLQYMALEIPTLMSPVGVNTEIIQSGKNGFLPQNENEWFDQISALVENEQLRQDVGKAGRETVEEVYSVNANGQKYLSLFDTLLSA